jgi:hypothetical protein
MFAAFAACRILSFAIVSRLLSVGRVVFADGVRVMFASSSDSSYHGNSNMSSKMGEKIQDGKAMIKTGLTLC